MALFRFRKNVADSGFILSDSHFGNGQGISAGLLLESVRRVESDLIFLSKPDSFTYTERVSRAETVGERLTYFLPNVFSEEKIPRWPPDVFCVCAAILHASGAYSQVVEDKPPHLRKTTSVARAAMLKELGEEWRALSLRKTRLPEALSTWWKVLLKNRNLPLSGISKNADCCEALLNLLAAADEAAAGVGIFPSNLFGDDSVHKFEDAFGAQAEQELHNGLSDGTGSTLCRAIHPSRGRVLPKMHTAQNGLTVRSLSHNLAFCSAHDINPEWLSAAVKTDHHGLNLLLIPWPRVVDPRQFKTTRKANIADHVDSSSHGLFTFELGKGPSVSYVSQLLKKAEATVGHVDGIVFPELSMSEAEFGRLSRRFVTQTRFLIGGIGDSAKGPKICGQNEALWDMKLHLSLSKSIFGRFNQKKHHRWKITKPQIAQYGISSNLHPCASWWEHIAIGERSIAFVSCRRWLTMSVLICEDLARPDPVGDILRAVGPNLIIALLSDGPQLIGRWPGRYAGALADDPGSSVLTVTSEGMSNLSQPTHETESKSDIVALWRDAKSGARELHLPASSSALLLTLSVEYAEEWTADGRGDGDCSGYPILTAVHPINVKESA